MKTLFKEITAKLDAVASIKWVDEDKGQMNFERPPVLFPAALVTISLPSTRNITISKQQASAQIAVKLCFNYGGNTNSVTPDTDRDRSLQYYDVVDEVYKALQGFSSPHFNALERRAFNHILRPDEHKTVVLTFTTDFIED
ncbi:hypothetical protein [Cellulophaga lytica]|uniref:hypothetical protein n=1 Tax=Cellulophaga lytica TaxID=979 RepID=UPI003CE498C6